MKIRFPRTAQLELDDAVLYYNAQRAGLGYEPLSEVFSTIDRIKRFPQAWPFFHMDTRRCFVRRFPYGVIYKQIDDLTLIVAIANLHRKPDHWINRLKKK